MAKPRRDPDYYSRVLVYAGTRRKLRELADWLEDDMIRITDRIVSAAGGRSLKPSQFRPKPDAGALAGPLRARVLMYSATREKLRGLSIRLGAPMTSILDHLVSRFHDEQRSAAGRSSSNAV